MYLTHNEGKSVIAERFIRTLKSKIYKYMTIKKSISKNVCVDKLDAIVNKYNNTYHSTIKMKPVDVKSNTYVDYSKEIDNKDLNSKLVILLEYQNIKAFLQKGMFKIDLKKFLLSQKLKILFRGHMLLVILTFYENELQNTNPKGFRIKEVIKRKGDKLYVKWKGCNDSFNSWIDKKDSINE